MPVIFGTLITAASYNSSTKQVTVDGQAFADTQYVGVSNIEVSPTGLNTWTSVNAIDLWGDTQAKGTLLVALGSGVYDTRITSSDGEQYTIVGGFTITKKGDIVFTGTFNGETITVLGIDQDGIENYLTYLNASSQVCVEKFREDNLKILGTNIIIL
jgi:hypothetical protein